MSTMMTFEYLSQLCQNKEQIFSLPPEAKDVKGKEAAAAVEQFATVPLICFHPESMTGFWAR